MGKLVTLCIENNNYNGCVQFEFNDIKALYTKKDLSEDRIILLSILL